MKEALIHGGYILLARKLLNSGIMGKPHLYIKLWIYFLLEAAWKDHGSLKRGQLITSVDELRDALSYKVGYRKCKPTKGAIRAAYDFLTKEQMIVITKITEGMLITILNYDEYQNFVNYEGHSEGHNEGTGSDTTRKKERRKKEIDIYCEEALQVLTYLNERTGKKFRDASHIEARLKDGGSVQDCLTIIDNKLKDPFFTDNPKYLNPVTLFKKSKWDVYLNDLPKEHRTTSQRGQSPAPVDIQCPRCNERITVKSDLTKDGCVYCEGKP